MSGETRRRFGTRSDLGILQEPDDPVMDLKEKPLEALESDLDRIAREYGPCDLVCADIESGTPDQRILELFDLCERLSDKYAAATE